MANSANYEKAFAKFKELDKASAGGDKAAKAEKAMVHRDVRAMERDMAREGVIAESGKIIGSAPSKRSLQEEYVRRFDDKAQVEIDGKSTTLRSWHTKRLLKP